MNLRLKRLGNDYLIIQQYLSENPYIKLKTVTGNPPEKYQLEYKLKSIQVLNGIITDVVVHQVEIILPLEYPAIQPQCRMLTPVFHPNIAPHAICIADHWAAGESLKDIIIRIGEMLSYQNYSIKSPLNGEAAKWAYENHHRLPLDVIDFRAYGNKVIENEINNNVISLSEESDTNKVNANKLIKCSNCGCSGPEKIYTKYDHGHNLCPDCVVFCQHCGKKLCIICEIIKCSNCGRTICSDCNEVCDLCKKAVCKVHIKECPVCGNKRCSKCMTECPECGIYYCRLHFRKYDNKCTVCYEKMKANKF